jgi:hypothetical protein
MVDQSFYKHHEDDARRNKKNNFSYTRTTILITVTLLDIEIAGTHYIC